MQQLEHTRRLHLLVLRAYLLAPATMSKTLNIIGRESSYDLCTLIYTGWRLRRIIEEEKTWKAVKECLSGAKRKVSGMSVKSAKVKASAL